MTLPKHLIIPDAHATPVYDNKRFKYLGKLIVEDRPDVIISIGDWADMPSLCHYDSGKRSFEGRRYRKDIEASIDAIEQVENEISKTRGYKPRKLITLGNHDGGRITLASQDMPQYEGWVGVEDLRFKDYGWEVYPFKRVVTLEGISYAHYFSSGVMGRPISGENIGKTMCNKLHVSAVQGHSHVYDHSERARADGLRVFGLSCGCFTHPEMIEDWNSGTQQMWWRGIVELIDLDGAGYYDEIKTITLRKLTRDFK